MSFLGFWPLRFFFFFWGGGGGWWVGVGCFIFCFFLCCFPVEVCSLRNREYTQCYAKYLGKEAET